ncbi:MAG: transcriptional antiterminator [Deltaproteobacteria bacterium]|nr:transcriptional antiterminator [Deltaproteobacteria bacterium]
MAWYAIHVRSNFERQVVLFLQARHGPETFLPTYRTRSRRAGATEPVERPLFPGYLFVRLEALDAPRVSVLQAPGVVRLVEFGGRPAVVDDEIVGSLRIIVAGPAEARPHPMLREGQLVRVVGGPFAGAVGRLVRGRGRKPRLVVSIDILGRAAAVPVLLVDVEPT